MQYYFRGKPLKLHGFFKSISYAPNWCKLRRNHCFPKNICGGFAKGLSSFPKRDDEIFHFDEGEWKACD